MVRLAAVATVKNEADIVGATLAHLYDQGVGNVYIYDGMSTDGTRDVLAQFPCKVFDDPAPYHRQPELTTELARLAFDDCADWVIPWDADEFWCPTEPGLTLAEVFDDVPADVGKLYAPMFHHYTWTLKETKPKPFPKVAFRAAADVVVKNGNHEAAVAGNSLRGLLEVRELQYRGEDHFVRKVRERNATLDPSLPAGEGQHHMKFHGMPDDQLRQWWRSSQAFWGPQRDVVEDPIPSRFKVGVCA